MIANIMDHFTPVEKINPTFHTTLLLSLSMLVPVRVVVYWNIGNGDHATFVGFKHANESHNNSDNDDDVDSTEVRFSESH